MKIIKVINNNKTTHYLVSDELQEARTLYTALIGIKGIEKWNPTDDVNSSVRNDLGSQTSDFADVPDDVVSQLPQGMQADVIEAKNDFYDRTKRVNAENEMISRFTHLVTTASPEHPTAHIVKDDLDFLQKFVKFVEAQERMPLAAKPIHLRTTFEIIATVEV